MEMEGIMEGYICKSKSSIEYISESENYIVMILATFMRVYNIKEKNFIKINMDDVSHIYISNDDRFMIFAKSYSPYVYLYDLLKQEVVLRKVLERNTIIKSIYSNNNGNVLIWLQDNSHTINYNGQDKTRYLLYSFNCKDNCFQKISNFDMYGVTHIFDAIYRIEFIDKNSNKHWISNCEIIDDKIQETHLLEDYISSNYQIGFSKDKKYYFIAENSMKKNNDTILDESNSQLIVYKNSTEILKINNRRANSSLETILNFYRGKFVIDNEGNHIFYTSYNQKIYLYYLEKNIVKEIPLGMPILNYYISFINDYLFISSPQISYSVCYIYTLHELL